MTGAAPTRVLMTADAVGGVWQYACDVASGLRASGVAVTLAVLGPAPSPGQRALAGEVPLVETGLPLDWLADDADIVRHAATAIRDLAVETGADLIHLNSPALACVPYPMPTLAVAHGCAGTWWDAVEGGDRPAALDWIVRLNAEGLRATDVVAAPSAAHARALAARYGVTAAVIHNGRDLPTPAADTTAQHALTAGRLWDRAKGIALLDRAAARTSVPVHAAGQLEGPQGERIALTHLRHLGTLAARAMAQALAQRPIFVSPALFEPFGLSVLEAAAAGCPLVLSDIATFRELWDGAALFVPHDEAAIADALTTLAADPDRRAALGNAAATRARRYTVAAMTDATLALYRGLTAQRIAA